MRISVYAILILLAIPLQPLSASEQPPSTRDRLQKALDVSSELVSKAVAADPEHLERAILVPVEDVAKGQFSRMHPSDDELIQGAVFPTRSQIIEYETVRPWSRFYRPQFGPTSAGNPDFPKTTDAPALRVLISDKDPQMRSLAIEALAVLEQPEDILAIAALLKDSDVGAPSLQWNQPMSATFIDWHDPDKPLKPVITRSWRKMTVGDYAEHSIRFMTGYWLNAETFNKWWSVYGGGRDRLWYWQQRIFHATREIHDSFSDADLKEGETEKDYATWQIQAEKKRQILADKFSKELRQESPEVEAKVKLLVYYERPYLSDSKWPAGSFFETPYDLRITPERLLDLFDGKDHWPDIDWDKGSHYNTLVMRGVLSTKLLRRKDVPRLRAILARESQGHLHLSWDGRAALWIGISRLLPPAKASDLDNPETRDGALRIGITTEKEIYTRPQIAIELIKVGLPSNWPFLKELFFTMPEKSDRCSAVYRMINAFAEAPLTTEKRDALVDLLLDDRFRTLWTQPNTRMGDDMCRETAVKAVNVYAGKQLITDQEEYGLVKPETSEKTLEEMLAKVKALVSSE